MVDSYTQQLSFANRLNAGIREYCWVMCRVPPAPLAPKRNALDQFTNKPLTDAEKAAIAKMKSPEEKQQDCYRRCHEYAFEGVTQAMMETVFMNKFQSRKLEEMNRLITGVSGTDQ
eukprot:TRINITY_DN112352_c0_g1_i1.p1 TRINITY_DN112352_c0_g1~~TRINITY_DN112352_c0_g1_i1.p1  ORF type:complete len:132 (-),score=11.70 TRINITY_DN112352_c0_g1_i1:254-601(-)